MIWSIPHCPACNEENHFLGKTGIKVMNWTLHEIPTGERLEFLNRMNLKTLSITMNQLAEDSLSSSDGKQDSSVCILANAAAAFADIVNSDNHEHAKGIALEMLPLLTEHLVAVVNSDDWRRFQEARATKGH